MSDVDGVVMLPDMHRTAGMHSVRLKNGGVVQGRCLNGGGGSGGEQEGESSKSKRELHGN